MGSTCPEICSASVLFEDNIRLYGGLMLRLLALSISCVVLIKLPSVSWNNCEICILLFGDMLLMVSLASSLCVSVKSDVVFVMCCCLLK